MKESEITALAREYAEEEYKTLNLPTDHTEVSAYRYMDFARFLLRRFCLVEKSKVKETYKACASMRDDNLSPNIESAILHHRGVEGVRVLQSLFPEIGKEVEE